MKISFVHSKNEMTTTHIIMRLVFLTVNIIEAIEKILNMIHRYESSHVSTEGLMVLVLYFIISMTMISVKPFLSVQKISMFSNFWSTKNFEN